MGYVGKHGSTCDCYNCICKQYLNSLLEHDRMWAWSGRKFLSRMKLLPQSSEQKPWRRCRQVSITWHNVTFLNISIVVFNVVETSDPIQTLTGLRPGISQTSPILCKSELSKHIVICMYISTRDSSWNTNTKTLKPDRLQHDGSAICATVQAVFLSHFLLAVLSIPGWKIRRGFKKCDYFVFDF